MEEISWVLPRLESHDRERLQGNSQLEEISRQKFVDDVCVPALKGMTDRLKLHIPDLDLPDPNDTRKVLSNVVKYINTVSAEGSE